ncbi:phosphoribosylformylglycinamidine synthase subunit PurL [Thermaerobacter litoralis]
MVRARPVEAPVEAVRKAGVEAAVEPGPEAPAGPAARPSPSEGGGRLDPPAPPAGGDVAAGPAPAPPAGGEAAAGPAPAPWDAVGLTGAEYRRACRLLGREPNAVELGLIGVLWSEHCAYKHSRPLLRRLPTGGPQVLLGPGENAGAVDLGDGTAVVFRVESHNHPSFVEPFQGAATGVGGILRDVLAAGARPVALMDFLCFADPTGEAGRRLVRGVVAGIAAYGNCTGVPVVGGRVLFEPGYRTNPLVNVLCVGLTPARRLLRGVAAGTGARLVLIGPPTGRDGVHGATFASASLDGDALARRPAVQVGDPLAGKVLIEACQELVAAGLVAALQDLGAGGLGAAAAELAARAGTGARLDLDRVPLREPDLEPEVILLAESQERMLAVVEPARLAAVRRVARRWGLPARVVGRLVDHGRLEVRHRGRTVADLPLPLLTRQAPVYEVEGIARRAGAGGPGPEPGPGQQGGAGDPSGPGRGGGAPAKAAVAAAAGATAAAGTGLPDVDGPEGVAAALRRLLGSPALASKAWIYGQFDHLVGGRTRLRPGAGAAAVLEVPGSQRRLAVAMAGTGRLARLDPRRGAALAVAEAALRVACTGARPLGLTNGLNLGDPGRPAVAAQLVGLVDGLAEACRALELPVTGGNVSLYNETAGRAIDPTVAVGVVGVIPPPGRWAAGFFPGPGLGIALLGPLAGQLGGSEYLKRCHGRVDGPVPAVDWEAHRRLLALLQEAVAAGWVLAARPVGGGGLLVTLAEMAFRGGPAAPGAEPAGQALGLEVTLPASEADGGGALGTRRDAVFFGEGPSRVLVAVAPGGWEELAARAAERGVPCRALGRVTGPGERLRVWWDGRLWLDEPAGALWALWEEALPCLLDPPAPDGPDR